MTNTHTTSTRLKLINAVVFFATYTQYCGKIKLFKLLYLMDFEHFSQIGKSVTGFKYEAWKFGPVPTALMEEWEELSPDLAQAVHIVPQKVFDYDRLTVQVNEGVQFNDEFFTPRQLKIMHSLAKKYQDTYSDELIDVTHQQNGAWDKVWQNGSGAQQTIPYQLSLAEDAQNRKDLIDIGAQQLMYQSALIAARQALNQPAAEY